MSRTKADEVRDCIMRRAEEAILLHSSRMSERAAAETIRVAARQLASSVAFDLCEEYHFLELSDIFEWKRQKVRR